MNTTKHHAQAGADALTAAQQAAQMPIPDGLMDTPAAAAYLGLKPLTLVDWRTKHQGPVSVKMRGAVRYLRSDLDAYIQSCRKGV